MDDINDAWEDIEGNVVQIVEEVERNNYEQCMNVYRNNIAIAYHKLEEYKEQENKFTTYDGKELQNKLELFEKQLMELWNQPASQTHKETSHFHQGHQQQSHQHHPHQQHPHHQGNAPFSQLGVEQRKQHADVQTIKAVHEKLPK